MVGNGPWFSLLQTHLSLSAKTSPVFSLLYPFFLLAPFSSPDILIFSSPFNPYPVSSCNSIQISVFPQLLHFSPSIFRHFFEILMGFERSLADRKGKQFFELPKETTKNNKSRKNRRRSKKPSSPIQKLYETCKQVFASTDTGIVPSLEDIQRLQSVLGMSLLSFLILFV